MFTSIKWAYKVNELPHDVEPIVIEQCRQRDGTCKYAIRQMGACYSKDNEWEFEPIPSSRDDEFITRCRYDTWQEAAMVVEGKIRDPWGRMAEYRKARVG